MKLDTGARILHFRDLVMLRTTSILWLIVASALFASARAEAADQTHEWKAGAAAALNHLVDRRIDASAWAVLGYGCEEAVPAEAAE